MTESRHWKAQRCAILLDVQNLFYATKNNYSRTIAYERFLDWAARGRSLVRAIAYTVEKADANQESFKRLLSDIGCELRSKLLIERSDGSSKGNWDVAIAVDAIQIAPSVDVVILGTGDGDFAYLTNALKYMGKRVEVTSVSNCTAMDLIQAADEYREIPEEVMMPARSSGPRSYSRKNTP